MDTARSSSRPQITNSLRRWLKDRDRRAAAVYIFGTVLQRTSLILFLPVLLRRLTVSEYGAFGLLQSVISLFPGILTLNLPAIVTRLYFDGPTPDDRKRVAAQTSLLALVAGLLLTLVVLTLCVLGRIGLGSALE